MGLPATINVSYASQGLKIEGELAESGDMGIEPVSDTLPAGKASTAWDWTDANTGTATLAENHGIVDDDIVDVYWDGGVRYGMTAAVTDNQVAVDGGAGNDLPVDGTTVILSKRRLIPSEFAGDGLQLIVFKATQRILLTFLAANGSVISAIERAANKPYGWNLSSGVTNPLAGATVASIGVSCGATADADFTMFGTQNAIT